MDKKKEIKKRIYKLRIAIDKYRYEYHVLNQSSISPEALDSLKKELVNLEEQNPEFITFDSPTQRVAGSVLSGFKKIEHKITQWSFNDAFSEQDIVAFDKRVKKFLKINTDIEYVCELKIDGLKIVLEYEKGFLKSAATRGDGKFGEDVIMNVRTIESIPLRLSKEYDLITEGEAFMPKSVFEELNRERKKKGEELYANPRNFAAGTLRQLDPKIVASRKLDSFIYDLSLFNEVLPNTQFEELKFLQEVGFKVNRHFRLCKNINEVISFWKKWQKDKEKEDYYIDGVVVKVNERKFQDILGFTGKAPRFGIAFKFEAEQTTTIIKDIVLQIGRMGTLTPVAHLRPVLLAGSTVSRATLHNEDEIKRLDVRVGDTVILQKAGDVIPDIISVVKELRTGKEKEFVWPKYVTECGEKGEIERIPGEAAWRCKNKNSFAQLKRKLYYFTSKQCFNIDHLGPRVIDALLGADLISSYDDIFTLKKGDILSLPRFGEKSVLNLLSAIEKSKNISFPKFIASLSIPNIGEETAIILAERFGNFDNLTEVNNELLEKIDGIGPIVAKSITDWFENKENKKIVARLLKHINIIYEKKTENKNPKFYNKIFVLTGTLETVSRDEAKEKIRSLGGSVSGSVSKETDCIVLGSNPGDKYNKGLELGITILSEKDFLSMLR